MKWSCYPQYKDSGIEWLGEIPEHWGNLKICRIGTLRNGLNKDKSAYGTGKRYVTVNDLYEEGYIEQEQLKRMEVTFQEYNQYSLQEHDILFARSSVKREGVGNPGIIEKIQEETVFSGFVIRLRVNNEKANKKYIYWLLRSRSIRDIVVAVSNTVAQTNLSQPNLKSIDICLPSTKEQKIIAAFLDRETSRIDKLIEKKEKQIELLKEKRAALISHAVTKGLDPNVKMKDSGIDWLGEIPEHWEVKRLKSVTRFGYGDSLSAVERMEGKINVFGSNGIVGGHNKANTKGPCIIIGRKGSFGKVTYSKDPCFAIDTTYYVDALHTIHQIRWLYYSLKSLQLDAFTKDSAVPGLSREDAYCNHLPLCNYDEQRAIATFLDLETSRIDKLIEKIKKSIELLKEYRTAIISAAVTGKIDVRGTV